MYENVNVEEIFGSKVFTLGKMRERLPEAVFKEVRSVMQHGGELSRKSADVVAGAMKDWAIENGATHYTHWFQPLTGITAEKHDSFIAPQDDGKVIMHFSDKELIQGEPDASSFPSGGLRATFEARGYTVWDITSPAFLKEDATGVILCIPTAFCSYTGEALDKKTPLLRSMEVVSDQALRIVRLFGDTTAKKVTPSVGPEQEYFLVDRDKYLRRPDMVFAGRTLFGAPAPKGQEMDDHYFGAIRERIGAFMRDLNLELWKLGVTAKTQHNEAAPAQHELAPIYETANIAVDHNQIIMETMKKVAERRGLHCLLNEKPYEGVNGSGKHNNWSLTTDTGVNLLDPGEAPEANVRFLLVLSCILKAVDDHADLLRQSAANVGNEHRLGADEAPPAIISVFLGEQLEDVVKQLVETGAADHSIHGGKLMTGVSTLSDIEKDATDRNRTSPFAFTGNKFEFRMVGSSDSIADANTAINTIVAEAFCDAADELEKADNFELAVHDLIKKNLSEHVRIIFSGDGYSDAWVEEAAKRGLPNIRTMVDAASALTTDRSVKLFERFGIYTKVELESREEIVYETYSKSINIEANAMIGMARKLYIPAVVKYEKVIADTINQLKGAGLDAAAETEILSEISSELKLVLKAVEELEKVTADAKAMKFGKDQAASYRDNVVPAMAALRAPVDKLETLVDKRMWPVPTYEDLMFEV